jgi:arsenate reductase
VRCHWVTPLKILFLCTGNSCRSIIAEALLRSMAPTDVTAQSAGSKPTGFVHPRALAALKDAGIATEGLSSKSWDHLPEKPNAVITLCSDAAGETCPLYFGSVIRSHWGMPDPAKVQGDEAAIAAAFADTLAVLGQRIRALARQLEAQPDMGATELQTVLDGIAAM